MPIRFRFRLIPFVVTVLLIALGITLAQWQTRRGDQKQAIETKLLQREAAPMVQLGAALQGAAETEYRRLSVRGEFISGWAVYLDNRPSNGVAGFYLLMPFKIADSDTYVLVMRGWLPRDPLDRSKLRSTPTPTGVVEIEGVARRDVGHVMQLGDAGALHPNAIVQNLGIAEFAAASHFKLQPFVIEQTGNTQDGLVRDWPKPSLGIEKHRGYAFQWYALAVMALLFFVATGFKRGTTSKPNDSQSI
ncbi:SURF1 family protein [Paraherbaspirillum soli]|uniref:SURF1-like protein n=1 Tax=Paraherbaspirillum soli TaxID=631222 RepID=A0ABW0M439_9BURK